MVKIILDKKETTHLKKNGYEAEDIKIFKKKREYEIETQLYSINTLRWSFGIE